MKHPILKQLNRMKYCPNCREVVEITMIGLEGYCPNEWTSNTGNYHHRLFTLDVREENKFGRFNKKKDGKQKQKM